MMTLRGIFFFLPRFLAVLYLIYITPCIAMSSRRDGVGFDLSTDYGTISVAYENGTTVQVGMVEGAQEYKDLMRRLYEASECHVAPPYQNMDDAFGDFWRRRWRETRTKLGLPATPDVAIISRMLQDLKDLAESELGYPITYAFVTAHDLVALYLDDLWDSMRLIGMNYIAFVHDRLVPHEPIGAYTAFGKGLCSNFTASHECFREKQNFTAEYVVTITYTRSTLVVQNSHIRSQTFMEAVTDSYRDDNLGSDRKDTIETYWDDVYKLLLAALDQLDSVYRDPVRQAAYILLVGESAADPELRKALSGVIYELWGQWWHPTILIGEEPAFTCSLGGAELCKRSFWDRSVIHEGQDPDPHQGFVSISSVGGSGNCMQDRYCVPYLVGKVLETGQSLFSRYRGYAPKSDMIIL